MAGFIGTDDAPRVLASQAAIGRRKDFNETELLAIMQLIENGSATRDQFRKASWAGALGQTQFMPSSLQQYGRDFDHDGHKDIWSNAGDALASAANYLTANSAGARASHGRSRRASRKASTIRWAMDAS
jgi:membrane-bound lytic murein transglycosylase B